MEEVVRALETYYPRALIVVNDMNKFIITFLSLFLLSCSTENLDIVFCDIHGENKTELRISLEGESLVWGHGFYDFTSCNDINLDAFCFLENKLYIIEKGRIGNDIVTSDMVYGKTYFEFIYIEHENVLLIIDKGKNFRNFILKSCSSSNVNDKLMVYKRKVPI